MKKLLYIITRAELGGAQRHIFELINYFKNHYAISLICGEKDWLFLEAKKQGVRVKYIKELVRNISPINDIIAFKKIRYYIKINNIDLVHAHSSKAGFIGRLAAISCDIPSIFTAHGWGFNPNVYFIRRQYIFWIEKVLAFKTKKIICVSNFDRNLALTKGVGRKENVVTIYNGIRDTKFIKDGREDSKGPIKIIMVARFADPKDQLIVCKAFSLVNKKNCELHFLGDGEKLKLVQRYIKQAQIDKNIKFLGSKDNVESLLPEYNIFVLCSHYEGLPISIIEAFRAGLPVVASDVGGIKELMCFEDENLVKDNDLVILADRLNSLIKDKSSRIQQGKNSREQYLKYYRAEKMYLKISNVYLQCISDKILD